MIQRCSSKRNGEQRYQYLVIGSDKYCFVKNHSKANNKYKQDELIQMLDFLIDNIFVLFGGQVFQQTIDIPMGTICASLFANLFLYAYDADFLSLSNSWFSDYLHHIYAMSLKLRILLILKSLLLSFAFTLVEVIATKFLRLSSQSGWPLRNIHTSNNNGSFYLFT